MSKQVNDDADAFYAQAAEEAQKRWPIGDDTYELPTMYIEIDCNGAEASGYEDRYNFVSYGTIQSEGRTLQELLDNATVDLVDQDGGTANDGVECDEQWMIDAITAEYAKRILHKSRQVSNSEETA
jgi:hypothetical protein